MQHASKCRMLASAPKGGGGGGPTHTHTHTSSYSAPSKYLFRTSCSSLDLECCRMPDTLKIEAINGRLFAFEISCVFRDMSNISEGLYLVESVYVSSRGRRLTTTIRWTANDRSNYSIAFGVDKCNLFIIVSTAQICNTSAVDSGARNLMVLFSNNYWCERKLHLFTC